MESITNNDLPLENPRHRLDQYPALAALRLTVVDLKQLVRQGFVCEERRGRRTYYKLRFRSGGQQVVRYIGNAERAALVNAELARLQAETQALRELKTITKIASKMLRQTKQALEPLLEAEGFVFHGLAIRRPRERWKTDNSPSHS